ncbi:redox-sensitive transcriptional activator SoxR [Lysobacter sp. K5869]|uniref:redox-sensitive transcriptional activator SoxR n=1 Tax=Lysobacter sp. K5869 TaxID=2820808 RepID=UPI001C062376|nr:redox-sensitive transcriptional activator SoxR [Lysobacter sp. K5869]QWP75691.1 redox-sensitive transcriptional activator SoxR [Lysobacter sp. K5869]
MSVAMELSVGQVAERSGVAVSALHFYEAKGLIHSVRTAGNQRRYSRDTLRRIAVIRVAQRVGMPLATIREALETLPDSRVPTRADWSRLSAAWKDELEQRIAHLTLMRDTLDQCIGCGCLSLDRCRLANPEDALGGQGTGAQRWAAALKESRGKRRGKRQDE